MSLFSTILLFFIIFPRTCSCHFESLVLRDNGKNIAHFCSLNPSNCYRITQKNSDISRDPNTGPLTRSLLERCKFAYENQDSATSAMVGVCSYATIKLQGTIDESLDYSQWRMHLSLQSRLYGKFLVGKWKCDDGGSEKQGWEICSGQMSGEPQNCPDGSDEKGCHYLDCSDGRYFGFHVFCRNDDYGGNCPNKKTHNYCDYIETTFTCTSNGNVKSQTMRCNWGANCADGSDEIDCQICKKNYNKLYHPEWINNGWSECGDGTDEPGWDNKLNATILNSFDTLLAFGALPSDFKNIDNLATVYVHQDGVVNGQPGNPAIQSIEVNLAHNSVMKKTCAPEDGLPIPLMTGKSITKLVCT